MTWLAIGLTVLTGGGSILLASIVYKKLPAERQDLVVAKRGISDVILLVVALLAMDGNIYQSLFRRFSAGTFSEAIL